MKAGSLGGVKSCQKGDQVPKLSGVVREKQSMGREEETVYTEFTRSFKCMENSRRGKTFKRGQKRPLRRRGGRAGAERNEEVRP